MIEVRFRNLTREGEARTDADGGVVGFSVAGHAGHGAKGADVVCAAVSAIAQTAVVAITKVAGIRQDVAQREGFLETRIAAHGHSREALRDLRVIVRTMMIGLDEVKRLHPDSITIDFE